MAQPPEDDPADRRVSRRTFLKTAGVNRGTTGEAMVVRNLRDRS